MQKNARIFIAGHRGLIGSAVARCLSREGYRHIITIPRAEIDLRDPILVNGFFEKNRPEVVVLAAGRVGGISENQSYPAAFMEDNLAIQLNVLKAAQVFEVTKLIFFGSSCMYPRECTQPMSEDILLSGRLEPTSLPYAISKLAGVHLCLAYNKQYGRKRFIPVIPNSVYGPYDNFDVKSAHVLSSLIVRLHEAKQRKESNITLWGSGLPRREFVHADDIANACLHLLQKEISSLEFPLNIGVGYDISIKELAEKIAQIVGYQGQLLWDRTKPDGALYKLLDSTRMRSFGWWPKVNFNEGLKSTYEWYVNRFREREHYD